MFIRIPKDRLGKLLGRGGKTKEFLEKKTNCKISYQTNNITVEGGPLDEMVAIEIIKAIGRGFSYKEALDLLSEDIELAIVEFEGTKKSIERLMGRVIGQHGRAKKNIEKTTGTKLAVKDKTVAILGQHENVRAAKRVVEQLLEGRTHAYAWKTMDKMMREARTI